MCGIVGLLIRRAEMRASLGQLAVPMLDCMGDRGPDSAGLAVFEDRVETTGLGFSLYWPGGGDDWDALLQQHRQVAGDEVSLDANADNALLTSPMAPAAVKRRQRTPKKSVGVRVT